MEVATSPSPRSTSTQISSRWAERFAYQSVLEITADKSGAELLRLVVRQLAEALGASHAFVAEFAGRPERVRTVAYWGDERWLDNVEFDLAGTPCSEVVRAGVCTCVDDVQLRFPQDRGLQRIGARSYLGVALSSADGRPIGHLAVLDRQPIADPEPGLSLLQLFAERARIELERIGAEHILRETLADLHGALRDQQRETARVRSELDLAYHELAALLRIHRAVSRGLERDDLFGALAATLSPLIPTDRFGIEVPLEGGQLRGHLLTPEHGELPERTDAHVLPAAGTACDHVIRSGSVLTSTRRAEMRARFPTTFSVMTREGMQSLCVLPLRMGDEVRAALFFMAADEGAYARVPRRLLDGIASAVAVALEHCLIHEDLKALRDQLAAENAYLQEEIRDQHRFGEIVGRSDALLRTLRELELVAPTEATVLITGETGTGKELVARALHANSARAERPLIKVNCAAIPSGLVESELFGHERGAFTGATHARTGRFELAHRGTLFLDEVGELPLEAQVKLLRVLQEHELERVGGTRTLEVDVRVVAATNRDLAAAVEEGRFRQDLYYRLSVFPLSLPPLRDRLEDVPLLAQLFLDDAASRIGRNARRLSSAALDLMGRYHWPGNVRELANVIERALIMTPASAVELQAEALRVALPQAVLAPVVRPRQEVALHGRGDLTAGSSALPAGEPSSTEAQSRSAQEFDLPPLDRIQRAHIEQALAAAQGRIEGPLGAATALGLSPSTLRSRMKRLRVQRPPRAGA